MNVHAGAAEAIGVIISSLPLLFYCFSILTQDSRILGFFIAFKLWLRSKASQCYSYFNFHVTSVLVGAESVRQLRPATG
jgi:hypothetical protein